MLTPTNDFENVPLNTPLIPQTGIRTPVRMIVPRPGTVSRPLIVREEPIRLSDGNYTEVRYVTGEFAKQIMILIFIALIPFGLFFLAFLPLCMKCKWMKDIEHIDPTTGNTVGIYRRGVPDAPSVYTYYRHPEGVAGDTVTQQPIPQLIIFKDRPVKLPDGNTTIVRKRIGASNLACVCALYWIVFWSHLCYLGFFGLCMTCLMDIEHIHPITREVVGVYYRSSRRWFW